MAKFKSATPAAVRTFAASDEGQAAIAAYNLTDAGRKSPAPLFVGSRGRLHPVHREVFAAAHPTERYVVGALKNPPREFKHKALDKRGRNRSAVTRLTLAEARALIGDTGQGRLDNAAVIAKLEANAGVKPAEVKTEKPTVSLDKA